MRAIKLTMFVGALALFHTALPAFAGEPELPPVTMYKNAGCGCCTKWAAHMREHGFEVVEHAAEDMSAVKDEHGVPKELRSCHTAVIGDLVAEGHVPARDILALLKSNERVDGIAVPGMPLGSPGMEHPNAQSFSSIVFNDAGETREYAKHPAE